MTFRARAGQRYLLMVGALEEPSIVRLSLSEHVSIRLEAVGSILDSGAAAVRATLDCSHPLEGLGQGTAFEQLPGGGTIEGGVYWSGTCPGETRRISIRMEPLTGAFAPGTVHIDAMWLFQEQGKQHVYATVDVVADVELDSPPSGAIEPVRRGLPE